MNQIYNYMIINKKVLTVALLIAIFSFPTVIRAQVVKGFEPRTSQYSPEREIYNIKGDFTLIGNTNMTLKTYSNTSNNGQANNPSVYVDIDGDNSTINSSMAELKFSQENNANPSCSEVIYAGLYWTGRAHDGGNSPMSFSIGGSNNDRSNEDSFNGYTLSISQTSSGSTRTTIYTFAPQNGGNNVVFTFVSNGTTVNSLTVREGNGVIQTIPSSQYVITNGGSNNNRWLQVALNSAYEITTGSQKILVNSLRKRSYNDGISSSYHYTNITSGSYKLLSKNKVRFKKDGESYFTVTASEDDIYYPATAHGQMYSAYAEVTDYIQSHGTGNYYVADIALSEGQGGGTGFYGGWALVVVYENSKMNWRDITVFDGHAYVAGSTTVNHTLAIEGFNAVQEGDVNIKIGMMAGEGDRGITGDYFQMKLRSGNDNWEHINHSMNAPTGTGGWFDPITHNFFNSSINTGGNNRNPNLQNNSGLDIAMFDLPNSDKRFITNGQTSTTFRYGSTQDTYIIPLIIFAVDAYIPDVEANNEGVQNIYRDGSWISVGPDFDYTVLPNDVLEFKLEIKNKGTEAVNDLKLEIPVPFSGLYVPNSATATYKTGITPQNPEFTYDGSATRPGSLFWNIGHLPYGGDNHDPDEVLATLTYKIKITDNCAILTNTNCTGFSLVGTSSGVGAVSGVSFSGIKFITGYNADGVCQGEPILGPYNLNIEVSDELLEACGDADQYNIQLEYCDITEIPFVDTDVEVGVREFFPDGSRFWSAIEYYVIKEDGTDKVVESDYEPELEEGESPVYVRAAANATEYTTSNRFPLIEDGQPYAYYAIPPGFSGSCFWRFTITVKKNCANYWVGTTSNDWETQTNWSVGLPGTTVSGEALPNNVIFATVDNNKGVAAKENLHINGDREIIDLTNDSEKDLVVTPGHQLKITGEILSHPDATGSIIVQAHKDIATGTFIVDPSKVSNVNATVQFYNKAYTCEDCGDIPRQEWQYFGIPVVGMNYPTGLNVNINKWDEKTFGDKWIELIPGKSTLSAFTGYEINDTRDEQQEFIYQFAGKLNIGDATVPLTYTSTTNYKGWNLIGNSYTAAIPISAEAISYSDDTNWEKNVYLFNTGSRNDWRKLSGNTVSGVESGRYTVVPIQVGGQAQLPNQIPSMHAFMVKLTGGTTGNLTLNYSQLTKNIADENNNQPAWRSSSSQPAKLPYIVMDVIGSQSADRVWLFEKMTATRGFDAGWDGEKMAESGLMQLYVAGNDDLKLQVATVPQLHDTYLGLKPDNNENISISFSVSGDVEPRGLHLRDMLTGRTYPIRNNAEYTLPGAMGENSNRFKVVTIAQGDEGKYLMADDSLIEIFVLDNRIGVSNKTDESGVATVYDITGKVVAKQSVERNATAYINSGGRLPDGVYVVKVKSGSADVSKRIMIK